MLTIERNGTVFPDQLPYCLFKKTEAGWFWDSGERFNSVADAQAFVAAECGEGAWHLVQADKAAAMDEAGQVEDFDGTA